MAEIRLSVVIPALAAIVAAALVVTPKELGGEMVDVLEAGSSGWPVDTGYSKANFGYRVDGEKVHVTNEADYAIWVERRRRPALRELELNANAIAGQLDKRAWKEALMADLPIVARVVDKTKPGLATAGRNVGGFSKRVGRLADVSRLAKIAVASIATAGIGLGTVFVASVVKGVKSLVEFEAMLRPLVERSRIAAEALQVLGEAAVRAGSDDGLEAITDSAQELQLQLGELALTGAARAEEAFLSLGLSWEKLREQSPEEAFRAVLAEIQKIPNVADRAVAAEEIFGGTSELAGKLAGIINLTTAEFAALEKEVVATSDIWSGEALASAKEFDLEMQHLRTELGRGSNTLVVQLLPALTSVVRYIRTDVLPAFQALRTKALEPLATFVIDKLIPAVSALHLEIQDRLEPTIKATGETIRTILLPKVVAIQWIIDNVVLPALKALWKYFGEDITKVFKDVSIVVGDFAEKVLKKIKEVWEEDVLPALKALWKFLGEDLLKAFKAVSKVVRDFTDGALAGIKSVWAGKVKPALKGLESDLTKKIRPAISHVDMDFLNMTSTFSTGSIEMGKDVDGLKEGMTSAFESIGKFITEKLIPPFVEIYEFVWPLVVETWEEHLKPTFDDIVALIRDEIIPWLKENKEIFITTWNIIKTIVVGVAKTLLLTLETTFGIIAAVIRTVLALIQGDWEGVWRGIGDFFEEIWEWVLGVFKAFGVDLGKVFRGIVNGVIGIIEAIPNAFISAINVIIKAWNGLSLKIPGFQKTVFGKTVGFKGFTLNTPNIQTLERISIPRLAEALPDRSPHAGDGGADHEAVRPLSRPRPGGIGGGGKTTFVIELDGERLGEYVINRVNQARRNGELEEVVR